MKKNAIFYTLILFCIFYDAHAQKLRLQIGGTDTNSTDTLHIAYPPKEVLRNSNAIYSIQRSEDIKTWTQVETHIEFELNENDHIEVIFFTFRNGSKVEQQEEFLLDFENDSENKQVLYMIHGNKLVSGPNNELYFIRPRIHKIRFFRLVRGN